MTDGPLRVLVEGQGALGTFFAAALAHEGNHVHVRSHRADTTEEVRLSARAARTIGGQVVLSPDPPERPVDLALVTARAADAAEQARGAFTHLDDHGVLVPLQNGLVALDIVEEHGAARVSPLVVGFNAALEEPRVAALSSPGGIVVGAEVGPAMAMAQRIAYALHTHVPARTTENPRGAVWSKWCVSCAINGLAVVANAGVGELARERDGRGALLGIVNECVEIARAEDVRFERVAGPLTPDRLAGGGERGMGAALRHVLVRIIGRRYRNVTPSALEALADGRDVELDDLNARAVRLGDRLDIPTPWNRAVAAVGEEIVAGKRENGEAALADVIERART